MAENLSETDSKSPIDTSEKTEVPLRKLYFINEKVEWDLTQYIWTGCTRIQLRDSIMSHAAELIRQIIRKQGLHTIYPGQEESAFGDLLQTAWCQLERTLYKYRSRPHCRTCFNPDRPADSVLYTPDVKEYGIITIDQVLKTQTTCPYCGNNLKSYPYILPKQGTFGGTETIIYRGMSKVFNMWSQISRTVILAYIKKEGRDRKNGHNYMNYLGAKQRGQNNVIERFLIEARQLSQYSIDHLKILDALEKIVQIDDRPHDGLIGKLVDESGLSRAIVTNFLRLMKLRSFEFTDSPLNRIHSEYKFDKRKAVTEDEEQG